MDSDSICCPQLLHCMKKLVYQIPAINRRQQDKYIDTSVASVLRSAWVRSHYAESSKVFTFSKSCSIDIGSISLLCCLCRCQFIAVNQSCVWLPPSNDIFTVIGVQCFTLRMQYSENAVLITYESKNWRFKTALRCLHQHFSWFISKLDKIITIHTLCLRLQTGGGVCSCCTARFFQSTRRVHPNLCWAATVMLHCDWPGFIGVASPVMRLGPIVFILHGTTPICSTSHAPFCSVTHKLKPRRCALRRPHSPWNRRLPTLAGKRFSFIVS